MPRIAAPTVVEHRANQLKALLDAARLELLSHGPAGVTLAKVGRRAGLARSSVYEYFPSSSEIITEIAVLDFAEWAASINAALANVDAGWPRLRAYVSVTLQLVADGRHRIADAVQGHPFSTEQSARFRGLHQDLMRPLRESLDQLQVPEAGNHARLIAAMLNSATSQLSTSDNPRDEAATLARLIIALAANGLPTATDREIHA